MRGRGPCGVAPPCGLPLSMPNQGLNEVWCMRLFRHPSARSPGIRGGAAPMMIPGTNRTSRKRQPMFAPFFRRNFMFSLPFNSHLASHDYEFYSEADFNAHGVERRRTERTKRPLLLVLLDAQDVGKERGRAAMERIAYALCSCSRKIDIKGWYKGNAVFGVVFTELPPESPGIREKLAEKIMRALSRRCRPDELQKVKVSPHGYPEEEKSEEKGQEHIRPLSLPRPLQEEQVALSLPRPQEDNGRPRERRAPSSCFRRSFWRLPSPSNAPPPGPVLFRQQAPRRFRQGVHFAQVQVNVREQRPEGPYRLYKRVYKRRALGNGGNEARETTGSSR